MYIFLILILAKFTLEIYLNLRNRNYIISHKNQVPAKFNHQISIDEHQKAANYNAVKINFDNISIAVDLILLLFWTLGGGLSFLQQKVLSLNITNSQILLDLITIIIFLIINFIINLPFSIYRIFGIETHFGFNKMTVKLFMIDLVKAFILFLILGIPLIIALIFIMTSLGNLWWIYAFIFLNVIQILIIYIYPTFIAPIFNKFSPIDNPNLVNKIEELLKKIGFKHNGIFIMDASKRSGHGNAYFTGFGKNKRIVFFDTLIKSLDNDEIVAVLAHELGHFKLKHILKGILISFMMSFVGFFIFSKFLTYPSLFQIFKLEGISIGIGLILFSLLLPLFTFYLTPLFSFLSRKHEFEADTFASKYANAKNLITGLVKMYKDNASTLTPDPAYVKFYHSHPPALTRIEHLEKLIK